MPEHRPPLDPWRVLARFWRLILAFAVVGAVLGGLLTSVRSASWKSSSTVQVLVGATAGTSPGSGTTEDPARIVATQQARVLSDTVVDKVASMLKTTPRSVRGRVTVLADTAADTLTVSASGPSAAAAQTLARAVTNTFVDTTTDSGRQALTQAIATYTQELAALQAASTNPSVPALEQSAGSDQYAALSTDRDQVTTQLATYTGPVAVLTAASLPPAPASLGRSKGAGVGLALGLLLGVSLALLRATRGEKLVSVSDIVAAAALPLLAEVPFTATLVDAGNEVRLAAIEAGDVAEAARGLAVALAGDPGLRTLLITSPGRYDGKTTVAAQLASASGLAGLRVLLVLADARSPALVDRTTPTMRGITDLIVEGPEQGFAAGSPSAGVTVVPLGGRAEQARDLLRGPRLNRALSQLALEADLVIIDAPAMTAPETSTLAMAVDGVLLCVGTHNAHRSAIRDTVVGLRAVSRRLLGIVVVDVEGLARLQDRDYVEGGGNRLDRLCEEAADSEVTASR